VRAGWPSSSIGLRRLHQAFLLHRLLVAAAHLADDVLKPLLDRLEIGQHQLGLDRLGVRDGIDATLHMGHVTVLETAQDVGDGIDLADIGEELVAETLALGRAFHEARDIDEGHPRGNDLLRLRDPGQRVEPGIGDRHLAHIGFDRAEGEVRRLRRRRARQRVEERGFAHVRKTDDPDLEAHGAFPLPKLAAS
jgi:hypothetical protein